MFYHYYYNAKPWDGGNPFISPTFTVSYLIEVKSNNQ